MKAGAVKLKLLFLLRVHIRGVGGEEKRLIRCGIKR